MARPAEMTEHAPRSSSSGLTLRGRIISSAAVAFAVSLVVGLLVGGWHARRSVGTELRTAQASGAQASARAVQEGAGEPGRLIRWFDGNRHLRATLLDANGRALATSHPASHSGPPAWFSRLVSPHLEPVRIPAGGGQTIVLQPDPANEAGEVWTGLLDTGLMLGMLAALGFSLLHLTANRALRPLDDISSAFGRLGSGDYAARVQAQGPAELQRVGAGFNAMAERLAAVEAQNRRLQEQLLTLQEEERADIARDLHDEIGPYLFAVNIDADSIRRLAGAGRWDDIPAQATAIQASVAHMQTEVREMLSRLRPVRAIEFGLEPAIGDLIDFWRARCPEIAFDLKMETEAEGLAVEVQEGLYRVAQEALSNAVRHGQPTRIEVLLRDDVAGGVALSVVDDGKAGTTLREAPSFGLVGMRERIEALGGALAVEPRQDGWSVTARAGAAP
ncbi:MAG: histidine kinase [Caulobacteraceae bacterium]